MIGYSTDKGGVESYIMNLYQQLKDKYEFVFCWPEMEIDGKKWVCPKNRHNYIKYYLFWRKFFKGNKFDVIYYNTCDIVSVDMLRFAKKAGIPVRIIHSHNTAIQQEFKGVVNLIHKFTEKQNRKSLHKYATHFLACSKAAGEWMFGNRKFDVIKNGIELEKYKFCETYRNECRAELGLENGNIIGCVGRLDTQKNPFFSIDVFNHLLNKESNSTLIFIGDGELKTELQNEVISKGLSEKIKFLGARNDVYKWLSAIDCLLMPSFFEGLPFVLVEAQASGLSCLVSSAVSSDANITGLVEYIDLDADKQQWADKLIELSKKERIDTSDSLIASGYATEATASLISKIIDTALGE